MTKPNTKKPPNKFNLIVKQITDLLRDLKKEMKEIKKAK